MSPIDRRRLAVAACLALALPFPSSVRYAPVARGFFAVLFERTGDVANGAFFILFGSVFYLVLYTLVVYGLLTGAVALWARVRP